MKKAVLVLGAAVLLCLTIVGALQINSRIEQSRNAGSIPFPQSLTPDQVAKLRREGNQIKKEIEGHRKEFARSQEHEQNKSRMKLIALAILLYSGDWNDLWPETVSRQTLGPYLRNDQSLDGFTYFRPQFQLVNETPKETVIGRMDDDMGGVEVTAGGSVR